MKYNKSTKKVLLILAIFSILSIFTSINFLNNDNYVLFHKKNLTQLQVASDHRPLWSRTVGSFIDDLELSEDGKYLVVGTRSHGVYLFDHNNSLLWNYQTGGRAVWSVGISTDGEYIVAGDDGGNIYLFNRSSKTPIQTYTIGSSVDELDMTSDGFYIAAGGYDGNVYLFNNTNPDPMWVYLDASRIFDLEISRNDKYITCVDNTSHTYLFNMSGLIWKEDPPTLDFRVTISENGDYIGIAGLDTPICILNKTGQLIANWTQHHARVIEMFTDGHQTIHGFSQYIYIINTTTAADVWNYSLGWPNSVQAIESSINNEYFVVGSDDYNNDPNPQLFLFHSSNLSLMWSALPSQAGVYEVSISTDGQYIAAGGMQNLHFLHISLQSPPPKALPNLILIISPVIEQQKTQNFNAILFSLLLISSIGIIIITLIKLYPKKQPSISRKL